MARLQQNATSYYNYPCPSSGTCAASVYGNNWSTDFAYGVGVQTRFLGLSVRAEYERISAPGGNPDALTVSATWTF